MQPHDTQALDNGAVRHTDYERELNHDSHAVESHTVSTSYAPGTDRQLRRAGVILVGVLAAGFVVVRTVSFFHNRSLARDVEEAAASAHPVNVVLATPVTGPQHFALPGETEAWYTSTIYARVNGYVDRWFVDIGDHVRKNQVLAVIDTPELDAQLAAARAQLKVSQASVLQRRAEAAVGKSTWERWRDSPPGVVSEQEREEKRAVYEATDAQLKSAMAQELLDEARVNQYQALTEFKLVRAPYDGQITKRFIDIGNLVTAGSTSATSPLYVMSQNDPIRVMVDVPQSAAGELVKDSLPVIVTGTGGSQELKATGKVTRTAGALNPKARTMKVEVDIPNHDARWLPGMFITSAFDLPPLGSVVVPAATLSFRSQGPQVAIVDGGNHVHLSTVTIARDDGNMVELGSGVKPGDRLILNLASDIGNGDVVQVNSESKAQ